jgi:2-phosphoglycerate kinase
MENKIIPFDRKRLEQSISKIGAEVADAVELSIKAKEMTTSSESILIHAQQELEELYLSLYRRNE